jgi:hypothetical protein
MAKSPFCTKLCGIDPRTGQPYYLSNPADAITQRISMMLQYLNTHGYNQNGTNWGNYLSGTTGESGRRRTRFRSEGEHHSGVNPNSIPF